MCQRTPTTCRMVERTEGISGKRRKGDQKKMPDGVGVENDRKRKESEVNNG